MNILSLVLKGATLGICSLVPGFSVGTMAIILGVYQKTIVSLSYLIYSPFKGNRRGELKFLSLLGIGFFISIIGVSGILSEVIQSYSLYGLLIYSLVLGLLVAPCPNFFREAKLFNKNRYLVIKIVLILFFAIMVPCLVHLSSFNHCGLLCAGLNEKKAFIFQLLEWFSLGVIASFFSILPGLSGALVLLIFGKYVIVLKWLGSTTNIKDVLIHEGRIFKFSDLWETLTGLHFILGCAFGALLTIYTLKYFFSHKKDILSSLVLGLMLASLILFIEQYKKYWVLFLDLNESNLSLLAEISLAFLFMCLGLILYAILKKCKVPTE